MPKDNINVLVAGAGGFTGGFIVSEGIRRGYSLWAGIRPSTSREYLTDKAIQFADIDYSSPESVARSLAAAAPEGGWKWIVYNVGLTKALRFSDFSNVNYGCLRNFTEGLKIAGLVPEKLLYMSSLSVMGPGRKGSYEPFTEKMIPRPDTQYGTSKLKAEMWLATAGIPHIIFRPTGVYGPRDNDYYLMYKSIARGFDFTAGLRRQLLSFIYVEDLARAVYDALWRSATPATYNIGEGKAYSQKEFRKIVCRKLGKKFVMPVAAPLWLVKAVCTVSEKIGILRLKPSTLNRDKYNILRQRNWNIDISHAREGFGFKPQVSLEQGIAESIEWNRLNNRL